MADLSVLLPGEKSSKIVKWNVKPGFPVIKGSVLGVYKPEDSEQTQKLRCNTVGTVENIVISEGQNAKPGELLMVLAGCSHPTVMKDMCAECGADLREAYGAPGDRKGNVSAAIAMVHSIPELIVSKKQAMELGMEDEERLMKNRKLVLLVDLDQTLIHTTNENVPPNLKDVFHFQLWQGPKPQWYHTKIRPGTENFLKEISKLYELHICTFGARVYAHTVTGFLDPEKKYFSHRILSRDECFNPTTKTANLKALFPRGDAMVCIIDDREDVWNFAPNLVHVKPYNFFEGTADINAPPGADKGLASSSTTTTRNVKVIKVAKKKKEDQINEGRADYGQKSYEGQDIEMKDKNAKTEQDDSSDTKEDRNAKNNTKEMEKLEEQNSKASTEEESKEPVEKGSKEPMEVEGSKDSEAMETGDNQNDEGQDEKKEEGEIEDSDEYEELLEWSDDDNYLENLEAILKNIHLAYYQMYDEMIESNENKESKELPSLRNIIPYVRRKTLQNCRILFTGVIPTNMPAEKHRFHVMARNLGATIQKDFVPPDEEDHTTHIIAINRTKKLLTARTGNPDIKVVTPNWLWACYQRWERADEKDYHPFDKGNEDQNVEYRDSPKRQKRKRSGKANQKSKSPKLTGEDSPSSDKLEEDTNDSTSSDSSDSENKNNAEVVRKPAAREQRKFSETYNPLYAFSDAELAGMDKEVEDLLDEDSESDSEEEENKREAELRKKVLRREHIEESSSEDSLSGNFPHGWGRKEKSASRSPSNADEENTQDSVKDDDDFGQTTTDYPAQNSDSDDESDASSIGSVDEEMAAAVEREFLSR